jgi:predicted rRNA methylase YqxC with S4 and FtsJ domains
MAPTCPVISLIDLFMSDISFRNRSTMTPAQTNINACNDLLVMLFTPSLFDQGGGKF